MSTRLDPSHRAALIERFVARDLAAVNTMLAALPGPLARLSVDAVCNARAAEAAPVWRIDPSGANRFRFHERTWDHHPAEVFGRWIDVFPLIEAVLAAGPAGSCVFNLGDEGHRPGLAFDGIGDGFTLVPDVSFIGTDGYAALAGAYAAHPLPWRERRAVAFWRGSTTGLETRLSDLPRHRLCMAALGLGARADIGFAAACQQFAGAEQELRISNILRDFVAPDRYGEYQLHVDIDGNSSPWTGFAKLHSGGAVLKVLSPRGYRQWYYDRLEPWINYVPVRSDLADLFEIVACLLDDPERAERIGTAGRALARSMSCEAELARAVPAVLAAFRP